jgi:hypothetical protein
MSIVSVFDRMMLRGMERRLRSTDEAHRIDGIALVDYGRYRYTPYFRQTFAAALGLIKLKDPRRFRRVCRYVKGIVALPTGYVRAGYVEQLQVCTVRFEPPPSKDNLAQWAAWWASMVVHEATHGLVYARGIPYDERYRERIERLCIKEEHRFLKPLLTPESAAKMEKMRTFNSDVYRWHWASSRWQRWRQSVRYEKGRKQRQQRLRDGTA